MGSEVRGRQRVAGLQVHWESRCHDDEETKRTCGCRRNQSTSERVTGGENRRGISKARQENVERRSLTPSRILGPVGGCAPYQTYSNAMHSAHCSLIRRKGAGCGLEALCRCVRVPAFASGRARPPCYVRFELALQVVAIAESEEISTGGRDIAQLARCDLNAFDSRPGCHIPRLRTTH
ncbi:hypothetical protein BV25DRAFT_1542026 [Artomyces pyxidatus]|uniref:Uncharacterized protein n=1 Tax=Artomyces pyxidatus TaxID=48021 RepID=A0ACB8SLP3_9AGAM|nr:hypothetical protein BV25DRAFT_1542026 [Artomyces pyxidatus]